MNLSSFFGLIAGVVAVVAYGIYFRQAQKNQSTPNPASWGVWVLLGIINAFTYFSVTGEDIWQSLIVIMILLSTLLIFVYSFYKRKFTKISNTEIVVFILALIVGVFWQTTHDARISNLYLQGIYLISYVPTIIGILSESAKEKYVSWLVVLVAYVFSTLSIIFGPHTDWIIFLNPLINGLFGTGVVVLVILYKNHENVLK